MIRKLTLIALLIVTTLVLAVRSSSADTQVGVAVLAEPQAGVTPFLRLIHSTRRSLELTMYELTDRRVEQALVTAAQRGVDVRVLLNGGYYGEQESTNATAYAFLAAHGAHVRYTPTSFALTHQKTLTVDGHRSAIMTLNFDGLYASTRDYAIIDSQPADLRAIVATFDADWSGLRTRPSAGSGDLVWSPGAQTTVLALIAGARHSIELENEELADAPATDALCAAARRGVDVQIVMTYESDWRSAFDRLSGCGVHVRVDHGQSFYIHAKLLELDHSSALIGSQNLSSTSLNRNRELGIDVRAPSVVSALGQDFASDYSGAEIWARG